MKEIKQKLFTEERALFGETDLDISDSIFEGGESVLRHSSNIDVSRSSFRGRHPLWYSKNVNIRNCSVFDEGRGSFWYADNVSISNSIIASQKSFRRCSDIEIENVSFPDAVETLWDCKNIKIKNISANGHNFFMNCENADIDGLDLTGKCSFGGVRNVTVKNAKIIGRDAFWNSENVTVEDSFISGACIGWNSKKLTFINCTIESIQGFCYIDELVLKNCVLINTSLAFEYSTVDADICGSIESVINPRGGIIRAETIGKLTIESDKVDVSKTIIVTES